MLDEFTRKENSDFKCFLDIAWQGPQLTETSPLHFTAWKGSTDYARHLIQQGQDLNALDAQQRTPLSWAAQSGHSEFVAFLLENGADTDTGDSAGHKPLHYAARANHHTVVKMLLAAGVSPLTPKSKENPGRFCGNAPTTIGTTPLQYACESGNTETVREMMPYLKAEDLNNSLCLASRCGKTQVVDLLLTSPEVSPDPPNANDTPLFFASAGQHLDIMRSLLKKGADPMRRSKNYGRLQSDALSMVALRKKEGLNSTPFHALCGASQGVVMTDELCDKDYVRKCFQTLSEAGCDANATDSQGKTPLHYSVSGRAKNLLSVMLLEAGSDPMAMDYGDNTPLHLLQFYKESVPTIEALIAHGADLNARRPKDGRTPIHTAVDTKHSLDLKVMLPYVKDWNVKDSEGNTPLHIILSKSLYPDKALGDLLEAGADLKVRNRKGEVPLHVAREACDGSSRNRGNKVLPLLLKAGADLEAKDLQGRTVLLRTLIGGGGTINLVSVTETLLGYGSKIGTRDNAGNGVLHAVCGKPADSKLLRVLIDAGANPHSVNHAGNSLLHEVAINYRIHGVDRLGSAIRLLLEHGLSPHATNILGQTPLHLVMGSIPAQTLGNQQDPLDLFLSPEFRPLIDTPDQNGVRPIHLAATFSEKLVSLLLGLGVDSTAETNEGRTLLHVAARARQSNIIGLVLDHLSTISRLDMVDHPDSRNRTALHDACRSGRPESVALLLKAGANPNAKDSSQHTPLHTCAEFQEEKELWTVTSTTSRSREMHARSVLLSDKSRPESQGGCNPHQGRHMKWNPVSNVDDTARIRDVIRLLIAHGVDVDALCHGNYSAVDLALDNGFEEMASELLPYLDRAYAKAIEEGKIFSWPGNRPRYTFQEEYATLRTKHLPSVLDNEIKKRGNQMMIRHARELLALREFGGIEHLSAMGLDFSPQINNGAGDFLSALTMWGYVELLETLGMAIKDPSWVNGLLKPKGDEYQSRTGYLVEHTF